MASLERKVLPVGGNSIVLPAFFPSVSSVKTNFPPVEYIELLVAAGVPQFLVSAYDLARAVNEEQRRMRQALKRARNANTTVLLDCGNYESYWHRDTTWSPADLARILSESATPIAFSFDDQAPPREIQIAVDAIDNALHRDQASTATVTLLPIVHGQPDDIAERVRAVVARLQPILVAVPERELGDGLLARAKTVRRIRAAVDDVSPWTVLHLLGTGNPLALLVFSIVGAQSFDGLEWCQTCVDPATAWLHHFQHLDLVTSSEQRLSSSTSYAQATLLHNLSFYASWMRCIQDSLRDGIAMDVLARHLPPARRDAFLAALERV